jgi:N-terminal domain of anti-restriction factor ArdC
MRTFGFGEPINREETTMTKIEIETEALDRARNGQSLANYPTIFAGFMAKGIAEADIRPRENVFTFNAWKAQGRSVKRGEHGVKVVTFIDCRTGAEVDEATSEEKPGQSYRRPHTTTVFHVSQTEPTADRDARLANKPQRHPRSRWASGHGRYPPIDNSWRNDPGELAADRWNETHGDRF